MGRGREWSQQEIEYLHKYAGSRPIGWMQKWLDRPRPSIHHKCTQLGLPTTPDDDYFSTGQLAKMLDCTASAINKRANSGALKSHWCGQHWITRKAFAKFYSENKRARLFNGVNSEVIDWIING